MPKFFKWFSRPPSIPSKMASNPHEIRDGFWDVTRRHDTPDKRTRNNLNTVLGYTADLTYQDYADEYARNPIAAAVVNRPVKDTWISWPRVYESDEKETVFEKAWEAAVDRLLVWARLARLDKIASLGEYAIVVIGSTNGGANFAEAPGHGGELAYLTLVDQEHATIKATDTDRASPRYGKPTLYSITLTSYNGGVTSSETYDVHWERVVHIVEGALTDDLHGVPRLQSVFNRLLTLEMVAGAGGEGYFRSAYPGISLKSTTDGRLSAEDVEQLQQRLASFANNLDRYILLEGMDLNQLLPQVTSPLQYDDVLIRHIAAASDIPQRILLGSERGQLASDQDERAWASTIETRRTQYVIPQIIRPLIDRLISLEVLPTPKNGYHVDWKPFGQMSPAEQAEVGLQQTNALGTYLSVPGAEDVVPLELFLRRMIGLSEGEVEQALQA